MIINRNYRPLYECCVTFGIPHDTDIQWNKKRRKIGWNPIISQSVCSAWLSSACFIKNLCVCVCASDVEPNAQQPISAESQNGYLGNIIKMFACVIVSNTRIDREQFRIGMKRWKKRAAEYKTDKQPERLWTGAKKRVSWMHAEAVAVRDRQPEQKKKRPNNTNNNCNDTNTCLSSRWTILHAKHSHNATIAWTTTNCLQIFFLFFATRLGVHSMCCCFFVCVWIRNKAPACIEQQH